MQRSLGGLATAPPCAVGHSHRASAPTPAQQNLALAEESSFLRFATPVPQPISYTPILNTLPSTEVLMP